jgi:hypothetical protein
MFSLAISYHLVFRAFIGSLLRPDDLWAAKRLNHAPEGFCAPGMRILGDGQTLVLDGQTIAEAQ